MLKSLIPRTLEGPSSTQRVAPELQLAAAKNVAPWKSLWVAAMQKGPRAGTSRTMIRTMSPASMPRGFPRGPVGARRLRRRAPRGGPWMRRVRTWMRGWNGQALSQRDRARLHSCTYPEVRGRLVPAPSALCICPIGVGASSCEAGGPPPGGRRGEGAWEPP